MPRSRNGKIKIHPSLCAGTYDYCHWLASIRLLGHSDGEVAEKLIEFGLVYVRSAGIVPPPPIAGGGSDIPESPQWRNNPKPAK